MSLARARLARRADLGLLLLLTGVVAIYGPLFPELIADWARSEDFSHGFLVVPLAAYLVWTRRERILKAEARPLFPGAFVLLFAVAQFLLGELGSEYTLQRASLVPFLLGAVLLLWGSARARLLVFPILFLGFMIPPPMSFWNSIALPLQLLASRIAEGFLSLAGIDAVRSGNVLHLADCSLEVAQACSGLRTLSSLLAISALLAEGSILGGDTPPRRFFARLAVFAGAVPVAIGMNSIRVATTALAASKFGSAAVSGLAHDAAGVALFALSLSLLFGWRRLLGWIETRSLGSQPSS